jgi:Family of unknown function (DUF6519)
MKGDFSRIRFNPAKNYTAVLQQQGRVALDADTNEQSAIDSYLRESTNVDVIGRYGGPIGDAGFAIEINTGGIWIGAGRYYVDGILVENLKRCSYSEQPFYLTPSSPTEAELLTALGNGETVQFELRVWRLFVTELDDVCLVEPALGQADTTARLQTVWRVVGAAVTGNQPAAASNAPAAVDVSETASGCEDPILRLSACCQALYKKPANSHTGSMSAQTSAAGDDCGCQPIPAAGYQGLENQLYRVEIHTGGALNAATFKWSRENASVVTKVTDITGTVVTTSSLGPDANLGFQAGQWVELTDDTNLFGDTINKPGTLYQIASRGPNALQVTLATAPSGVDTTKNARMRRWDQSGASASTAGISLSTTAIPLENGIEVAFSPGNYASGDYWTFPARTATGQIDWSPCGGDDGSFKSARYFNIYTVPLACVTETKKQAVDKTGAVVAGVFVDTTFVINDCRLKFYPLTDLQCGGTEGPCTIVPKPGAGWEEPIKALPKNADADICFPIGTFPLTKPLVLAGLGNIRITGGGPGTKIVATGVSAALVFSKCASVQVSDLYASTDTAQVRNQRTDESPALGGTLSFADCPALTVEDVSLQCGFAEQRTVSCIDVQNTFPTLGTQSLRSLTNQILGAGEVRIRHCNLSVGRNQNGILLVGVERAQVEDNILTTYTPKKQSMSQRLQDRVFRATVLREFVSNAVYVKAAQPTKNQTKGQTKAAAKSAAKATAPLEENTPPVVTKAQPNVSLSVGNASISFHTNGLLKNFWNAYVQEKAPKTIATNRDLLLFVKQSAENFLLQPKLRAGNSAITGLLSSLERADQIAMARGIAVGGEGIQECRILNNSISNAIQGITVGMSNHKMQTIGTRDSSSVVTIAGNQIYTAFPLGASFHGHQAIFVGNVNSLVIENNFCNILDNANQTVGDLEGIRVWGVFGYRAIIRHCHLVGFNRPIVFNPIELLAVNTTKQARILPLWLVADNMAEYAAQCVFPGLLVPSAVQNMWINNLKSPA